MHPSSSNGVTDRQPPSDIVSEQVSICPCQFSTNRFYMKILAALRFVIIECCANFAIYNIMHYDNDYIFICFFFLLMLGGVGLRAEHNQVSA